MATLAPPLPVSVRSHPTAPLAALGEEQQRPRGWIVSGAIAAILADVAYISAIAPIPFPDQVKLYLAIAFGPLLSFAFVGLYHFFQLHRTTVALQAATLFGIIAGTLMTLMVVVQSAIHLTIPADARASLGLAYTGLNMVQLGIDVTWDVYLSVATMLLGVVMWGHPRFGPLWAIPALLIGAGLLVLNLATFPVPPVNAGSYDLGPLAGVLYLAIAIRVLGSRRWVAAKTVASVATQ